VATSGGTRAGDVDDQGGSGTRRNAERAPFEALPQIYPGGYGATGEIEIRRVFELEGYDAST
jgi:hypothetical protein